MEWEQTGGRWSLRYRKSAIPGGQARVPSVQRDIWQCGGDAELQYGAWILKGQESRKSWEATATGRGVADGKVWGHRKRHVWTLLEEEVSTGPPIGDPGLLSKGKRLRILCIAVFQLPSQDTACQHSREQQRDGGANGWWLQAYQRPWKSSTDRFHVWIYRNKLKFKCSQISL